MKLFQIFRPQTPLFMNRFTISSTVFALLIAVNLTACVTVVSENTGINKTANTQTAMTNATTGRFDRPGNAEEPDVRRRAKIRLELAANYFQSRQGKIALDEVNNALAADSTFAEAYVLKGLILMEANQTVPADASFKMALALNPADADANNTYGWFLCQNQRIQESFNYFEKASTTPFYATPFKPLLNAGICATKLSNYPKAENYLLSAQALDNNSTVLNYHLASLYLKMGDSDRAMAYTRKVLANETPTADTLWLGIKVAKKANDLVALEQLVQVLRDNFITSPQWALYMQNRFDE
jgi:type IV pilus assembly protein PilF